MSTKTMNSTSAARLPPPSQQQDLKCTPVFDATEITDDRRQALQQLLSKGHITVAPLREPKLILHSHLPHLLGSAYILGASRKQLEELYEHEITSLVHVDDTFIRGHNISTKDWRNFLGEKSYTVAYVDFFDDEVKRNNGDWKIVLQQYLFSGPEPLINGFIGGLGHPFIHLAYAWELQNPAVATEALSLGCTEYISLHSLLDQAPPDNSTYKTTDLGEIISRIKADDRLDNLFTYPGITNIGILLGKRYDVLLEHWNAWQVTNPLEQLEKCCDLSLLLGIGTGDPVHQYDFYLIHTMTVAQAIRVLWHMIPKERHASILKQYALFLLLVYICQIKPDFPDDIIERVSSVDLRGRDWTWVMERALSHPWAKDSHFFKVVRAPMAFEDTFGKKDDFYLKASVKYLAEFDGWEGFGEGVEGFLPNRDGFRPDNS
ncbi:hypothetical protein N7474_001582 [Penicillium riverlandense]|uniref:uncharacterized protein n=1 Tax=Penicillium riverlandense TaxID=1903569 RepID=UPI00254767D0|nr:uncharacterized protein N7474_001582 [Penicillium riverlandense]KAJ5833271.1 hypothetical protein N7474_001582 [Penicillium riverlandense]